MSDIRRDPPRLVVRESPRSLPGLSGPRQL